MKFTSLIILTIATLLGFACGQSNNSANNQQTVTPDKELIETNKQIDTLGPVFLTIDFKQKASGNDLKIFEDGFIPWISIDNPKKEITNLVDADKIILPFQTAKILIDYPLNNPATFEIMTAKSGYSRRELITEISNKYHEIYKVEEITATTKTIPPDKRKGLRNRNQTDGKYGVWGHDLSDLVLSQIEVHKNTKGEITLTLGVES